MTLGEKLQKLRKGKGLSQEALAEKLNVTRQTISKWELGQSTPDLSFLAQLSDFFHVSSDYLIKDELTEPDELPYRKRQFHLTEKLKRTILAVISAASLIAIWVCLICDYFTSDKLSWSLIAGASIAAGWLFIFSVLTAKTAIIRRTLLAASIIPIPLLAVFALLLKNWVVFKMGACISLTAIAVAWIIYWLFRKYNKRLWRAFGFSLLALVPVPIIITHISACFLPKYPFDYRSDVFNSALTLVLSLACLVIDCLFSRKTNKP